MITLIPLRYYWRYKCVDLLNGLNEDKWLKMYLVTSLTVEVPLTLKKNILKVEYLKKYKVFKKSEKKRAIPSYSEYLKIWMESLGEILRKEIHCKN